MADNQLALPVELLIVIFIENAKHPKEAGKLCCVSKWVRDVVEPVLYRVLALKTPSKEELRQRLVNPKWRKNLRALGVVHGPVDIFNAPLGPQLRSIHNFATAGLYNMGLINNNDLQELHLFTNARMLQDVLPKLQKFHFSGRKGSHVLQAARPGFSTNDLLRHSNLTHIAFSVEEDPGQTWIIPAVERTLKENKSLSLLLVRLLRSTSLVLRGTAAADYESAAGRLARIGDPRLVVQRVEISMDPEALLDEWESNVRSGRSIWDWAESQLAERMSTRRIFDISRRDV